VLLWVPPSLEVEDCLVHEQGSLSPFFVEWALTCSAACRQGETILSVVVVPVFDFPSLFAYSGDCKVNFALSLFTLMTVAAL
jgi:hypothetical protein